MTLETRKNLSKLTCHPILKNEERDKMSFGQFGQLRQDRICRKVSNYQKVRKETRCLLVNFDFRDKIEYVYVNLSPIIKK